MAIRNLALAGAFVAAFASGAIAAPLEFVVTGVVGSDFNNDAQNLTGRDYTATYRIDSDVVATTTFQNATFA